MKEDRLKSFINKEREAFETEEPRIEVWDRVIEELEKEDSPPGIRQWKPWSIAATILLLIAAGSYIMSNHNDGGEIIVAEEFIDEGGLSTMGSDMAEIDNYYATQVNERISRLKAYEVDEELMEEMTQLNGEFEALKSEMGNGMDDSKVVEAMIDNYRLRLALLEDLLEALGTDDKRPMTDEGYDL